MSSPVCAASVLNRDFLDARSRALDLAAVLDRITRANGAEDVANDVRLVRLQQALSILLDGKPHRAERVQMAFSLPYDVNWRQ